MAQQVGKLLVGLLAFAVTYRVLGGLMGHGVTHGVRVHIAVEHRFADATRAQAQAEATDVPALDDPVLDDPVLDDPVLDDPVLDGPIPDGRDVDMDDLAIERAMVAAVERAAEEVDKAAEAEDLAEQHAAAAAAEEHGVFRRLLRRLGPCFAPKYLATL